MRILEVRPFNGSSAIAHFDVEINNHLRLYNLTLRKGTDGRYRTFAPNAVGRHAATFHPILASELTQACLAALKGGVQPHDQR